MDKFSWFFRELRYELFGKHQYSLGEASLKKTVNLGTMFQLLLTLTFETFLNFRHFWKMLTPTPHPPIGYPARQTSEMAYLHQKRPNFIQNGLNQSRSPWEDIKKGIFAWENTKKWVFSFFWIVYLLTIIEDWKLTPFLHALLLHYFHFFK